MVFRKISLIVVLLSLLQVGFTWYNQDTSKNESPSSSGGAKAAKGALTATSDRDAAEKPETAVNTKAATEAISGAMAAQAVSHTLPSIQSRPSPLNPSIMQIQTQINDIIRLNEGLRSRYREQVDEIQKINEQSRIHKRILEEINSQREAKKMLPKAEDADTILEQEKIRLIEKQAQENRKFIEGLEQEDSQNTNQKPAPGTAPSRP